MPVGEPDYVEFGPDDPGAIVAVMEGMAVSHEGWINFEPAVLVDDVPPPRTGLAALVSGRGPDVPLGTWAPGEARKGRSGRSGHPGRPEPPTVGLQHGSGPGARARLADAGRAVPEGWVVLQDHSKKGLVVAVPPTVAHLEVVDWLLGAAALLSRVPLTGRWRAAVYGG
ncbi:MAG: hypothetical protein ACLGI2_13240 [Acidimicrobiia bacterium]